MNTKIYLLSFVLLTAISCKKDDKKTTTGTTDTPAVQYDKFSLKVNGVSVSFSNPYIQHNGLIIMQGATGNSVYNIAIEDTISAGTFPISDFGAFRLIHSDDGLATGYRSTSGSVTVVEHDKTNDLIKGYYNCTLTRDNPASTKTVTDGEFNFQY